ncbi:sorbitol dehydrogenase-like [Haliotis cracherodii]|uniref:sorbitol dehydrogenase-like n=1 Tax=Haliotis cracherodii TaxID=6455 RepID=UPI0039E8DEAE
MADENLSVVLYGKQDLRLEDRPKPVPGYGEVQICIHDVGICGSDVSYWQNGCIGDMVVRTPMVMGHEPSGVVSKVGKGVETLKVGDRVAIEPGVPCRTCGQCKTGRYNLCGKMKYCATPPDHGTLSRYFVHAADFCFKLPDNVSMEEGAMLQPLAVAVHACNRVNVHLGATVLVCGAGPVGLICMLTARARGAAKIIITDINEDRLKYAKRVGADHIVLAGDPQQTARTIQDSLGGAADVTIECSGAPSSVTTAIYATATGGRIVLVGLGPAELQLPLISAQCREVDILGMIRFANTYPAALAMVTSGQVDVKQLITHRYRLEEALDAYEAARRREGVKIIINCQRK